MPDTPRPVPERLLSLDALRGFDMCWILGLATVLTKVLEHAFPEHKMAADIAAQFEHVDWEGFRFYDLIFPLFLFLSGVSLAIALPRRLARDGRGATVRHLLARAGIIFILGVIFSGGLRDGWEGVRWLGVLQRIGIASAAAGLLSLWLGTRGLVAAAVSLLIGYFLLLRFVPVPGAGAGNFAEGMNLTNYLDSIWLPGRKYDGDHDPEGILSTLPAIATAVLGLLAGRWITGQAPPTRKVCGLLLSGVVMIILGWTWHPFFPVIKKIWSSSFVLVAGGWSAVLLGVFYALVDVHGWRRGLAPFFWVGANPIALYLCAGFGFFRIIAERLVAKPALPSAVTFVVMLITAWWLHRRKIFLRV
ncbi:MAG: acyltransferase family protein [Prosthecobacter sp.]